MQMAALGLGLMGIHSTPGSAWRKLQLQRGYPQPQTTAEQQPALRSPLLQRSNGRLTSLKAGLGAVLGGCWLELHGLKWYGKRWEHFFSFPGRNSHAAVHAKLLSEEAGRGTGRKVQSPFLRESYR